MASEDTLLSGDDTAIDQDTVATNKRKRPGAELDKKELLNALRHLSAATSASVWMSAVKVSTRKSPKHSTAWWKRTSACRRSFGAYRRLLDARERSMTARGWARCGARGAGWSNRSIH